MRKPRRQREHRRCAVPECRRHALPGRAVCLDHLHTPAGRAAQDALARLTADLTRALTSESAGSFSPQDWGAGGAGARHAARAFRDRLQRGDYTALLKEPLARLVEQAAARRGLADELGALRLLLVRLLADALDADDPTRLATAAARVADAAGRLARAHHDLTADEDRRNLLLEQLFAELDEEPPAPADPAPPLAAARAALPPLAPEPDPA